MPSERPTTGAEQAELKAIADLVAGRRRGEALSRMRRLASPEPVSSLVLFSAASLALRMEAVGEAREWLLRLARRDPPDWQSALQVVEALRGAGLADDASDYLERLSERFPEQPVLVSKLGNLAAARGELDSAREHYLRALQMNAALSAPYLFLARDPHTQPQALLQKMGALDPTGLSRVQQANLSVATGHCYHRLQEARRAFEAFETARSLTLSQAAAAGLERQIESAPALVADFSASAMAQWSSSGHPGKQPVFVAGMPRSGSTLVAQVLGAHSQVANLGERRILGNIVMDRFSNRAGQPSLLQSLVAGDDALHRLGQRYLDRAGVLAGTSASRWIDKMPFNFSLTGAAHLALPGARTIYTQRNPLDTCWSMYTAAFGLDALQLDLAGIGRLHALSEYLMAHWRAVLPRSSLIDVSYEALVMDFEPRARALVGDLELAWEPACLTFHEQRNEVLTASDVQVHQPVHAQSVGRAAPYAQWLGPFEAARESTLRTLQDAGAPQSA